MDDDTDELPERGLGWEDARDEERGLQGGETSGLDRAALEEARRKAARPSRGPRSYQRPDARIREDICERLFGDTGADASDVTVKVSRGEVTLGGTVPSDEDARRILLVATSTLGVTKVHDTVRVTAREPERVG